MIWPTLIMDNFFTDPDKIVEISKRYTYTYDGTSPGMRSPPLHVIDHTFFNWSTFKILTLLYPNEGERLRWHGRATFHRVPPNLEFDGWIHKDTPDEFTAIIYLSKGESGTSLFEPLSPEIVILEQEANLKYKYFKNPNLSAEELAKVAQAKEKNNAGFRETLSIDGRYNRLILFDSAQYHAAHVFKHSDSNIERLTYIVFFDKITIEGGPRGLKFPGTENRRT